ncbi:MAG: cardiolipin synthase, partial [Lautropia sp.]|nr:cardiolipin synthase [Lautropia sp.]
LLPQVEPGEIPVQIVTSGPDAPLEAIHRMHVAAIHASNRRAWLTTPYFVPTEPALLALTSAALRGVDVRLLVPRRSDSIVVSAAARSYYDDLIAAGVKVWEYKARMLHSKTLVIDDNCAIIGTPNFDNRSFRLNFEVVAAIYDAGINAELAAAFESDLAVSVRLKSDHSKERFGVRLMKSAARLAAPLL